MSGYPVVRIGEHAVANGCSWSLASGVRPNQDEFDVSLLSRDALLQGRAQAVTLFMGEQGAFKDVYILQSRPADRPDKARVVVSDRRWLWEYPWIIRSYNVRRAVGPKRLEDPTNLVTSPVTQEIAYAPWSLKNGTTAWTAVEVLKDVFGVLAAFEVGYGGPAPVLVLPANLEAHLTSVPIENLELDCNGADAFERVLRYLPGVNCYVDPSGRVVVYAMGTGDETQLQKQMKDPLVGEPRAEKLSLARVRPAVMFIGFSRRVELRFDFADSGSDTTDQQPDTDLRLLSNVAPVTDFYVTIGGKKTPQDTWVEIESLMAAWGGAPFRRGSRPLTKRDVRRCLTPFMSLLRALQQSGLAQPDKNWPSRCGAIAQHFRQTFRIPRRWMDRIMSWDTNRVGTIDTATGTRGAAAVYSDFSFLASERSMYQEALEGQDLTYITNVAGYPSDDLIGTGERARTPGELSAIDEDIGIFRVDYHADGARLREQAFPSQIEKEGDNTAPGSNPRNPGPCGDPTKLQERGFSWGSLVEGGTPAVLTKRYKLAVILTCMPAPGANGADAQVLDESIHWVRVGANDVPPFVGQRQCDGPIMYVHVGASIETARVTWSDDPADVRAIEGCFGKGQPDRGLLEALTINSLQNQARTTPGGASLTAIAQAVAAPIWHALADRVVGAHVAEQDATLEPAGWVDQVVHSVSQKGLMTSGVRFPDRAQQINFLNFLDANTRRIVLHLARGTRS